MSCVNCAQSIVNYLEESQLDDIHVDFATGKVAFTLNENSPSLESLNKGLQRIGYQVISKDSKPKYWTLERKLILSAILTIPLVLGHFLMMGGVTLGFLGNPYVQFALALPVIVIGLNHFGKSAIGSLRGGVPNMDVLVFVGGLAATVYSLVGLVLHEPDYIFFETAASIFTLVLFGNYLEHRSVKQTTTALSALQDLVPAKAKKLMPSGAIVEIETDDIQLGDIIQVNEGDRIACDGKIVQGFGAIDESMITGESLPVEKSVGQKTFGGTILLQGNIQVKAMAVADNSLLGKIIDLVEKAQNDKPPIQRLADKISAIFVPVVISIALLTFFISWLAFDISVTQALINSIAVLVISCPCAMGLATPTAVMVGVGRMAQQGIVIKGGQTVEAIKDIKNIVFDKTGTLTTGKFKIENINYLDHEKERIHQIINDLESKSSHPLAWSLLAEIKKLSPNISPLNLHVQEKKGVGIQGTDGDGRVFQIGSQRILAQAPEEKHDLYLTENGHVIATIDLADDLKAGAKETVDFFHRQGIEVIMLSGDRMEKVEQVAQKLGIKTYFAEQLPQEKLEKIGELSSHHPTAMVGDGINDAPALAKASLGISMGQASAVAIDSAQVILLNDHLSSLEKAFRIGNSTVKTIRENLFWAFAYNVVAIPIAAMGYLNPMLGAMFMAFSDVVVIGNSLRLKRRRI
ncbi:MAG TPA: cadmium-translocating P-type ATPase [Saprospiraceae bacterium]|nr:cadmium-translocating P-type ATPase [Saprospiraceae bacterium]